MATKSRASCCWGCLTKQLHPKHFWAAGKGRAVFHTWHGQQQVWNERCSLHTERLCHLEPLHQGFLPVTHCTALITNGCTKPWKNPKTQQHPAENPWNTQEAEATYACSTCPNSRVGITPACLSQGASKENSLFVPRSHRPSGAHHRREFPRIHAFSVSL